MACSAVTSDQCTHPANLIGVTTPRPRCYECGQAVCLPCSSLRTVRGRRARICDNCLSRHDDGEALVLLRRFHQAGYPTTTLDDCRRQVARAASRF